MSNAEFPDELKGLLDELSKELRAKRFQKHLDTLKRSVQNTQLLANSVQSQFQSTASLGTSADATLAARKALVSSLQLHSLTLSSLQSFFSSLSAEAQGLVQRVLDWILQNIVEVLSKFSAQLNVYTWSVEVTGGLPLGVSFSVIVTFK